MCLVWDLTLIWSTIGSVVVFQRQASISFIDWMRYREFFVTRWSTEFFPTLKCGGSVVHYLCHYHLLHFFFKWGAFLKFIYLFYLWLCWVFISVRGLSLVVASGGHSSSRCAGLSLSRPLLLRSTGSRRAGSVIVAHGPSCSAACGIFPDQGSNLCPLHWQADSQPLRHQGSPLSHYCMEFASSPFSPSSPSNAKWS